MNLPSIQKRIGLDTFFTSRKFNEHYHPHYVVGDFSIMDASARITARSVSQMDSLSDIDTIPQDFASFGPGSELNSSSSTIIDVMFNESIRISNSMNSSHGLTPKYIEFVVIDELEEYIDTHFSARSEEMKYILAHENWIKSVEDGVHCYINENKGTFRGLAQFNKSTWMNVSNQPYYEMVTDIKSTIEALEALCMANLDTFIEQGFINWNKEVAYLYHNQGAGSAANFLRTGVLRHPKQSAKAIALFNSIEGEDFGFYGTENFA